MLAARETNLHVADVTRANRDGRLSAVAGQRRRGFDRTQMLAVRLCADRFAPGGAGFVAADDGSVALPLRQAHPQRRLRGGALRDHVLQPSEVTP